MLIQTDNLAIWTPCNDGTLSMTGRFEYEYPVELGLTQSFATAEISAKFRWNPWWPDQIDVEVSGHPKNARSLPFSSNGNEVRISGWAVNGGFVILEDVHLRKTVAPSMPEKLDATTETTFAYARSYGLLYRCPGLSLSEHLDITHIDVLLEREPSWNHFRVGYVLGQRADAHLEFSCEVDGHRLSVVNYESFAENGDSRIYLAIRSAVNMLVPSGEIGVVVRACISRVRKLLRVAGLPARRRFSPIGGIAYVAHSNKATSPGNVGLEFVFPLSRQTYSEGWNFNDVNLEGSSLAEYLTGALEVLTQSPERRFLEAALDSYLEARGTANIGQRLILLCNAHESAKQWYVNCNDLSWTLKSKSKRKQLRKILRAALTEGAKQGLLDGVAYREALAKINSGELLRHRFQSIVQMMIDKYSVQVEDLFRRNQPSNHQEYWLGHPWDLDFYKVRNNIVHRGTYPASNDYMFNVTLRTEYLLERLLFRVLRPSSRCLWLKCQSKVEIMTDSVCDGGKLEKDLGVGLQADLGDQVDV